MTRTATRTAPLLDRILALLQKRADIRVLAADDERITGVQLRRVWEKQTINAGGFNPHDKEMWHYYGQTFVIEQMQRDRRKDPDKVQQVRLSHLAAVGTLCIPADDASDVLAALGTEPHDLRDWLARKVK